MRREALLGLAMLAASALGLWVDDARVFLACWLSAWWWCLGLVLGSFVNAWMQRLTGGAWGLAIAPVAIGLGRRLPWLLLLLAPVLAGLRVLYPWASPTPGWDSAFARPAFIDVWLSPSFFIVRVAVYGLVWYALTRATTLASKGRAAASLGVHLLVSSLAAVDLLMSLMPTWVSTAFGLVVLGNQALAGASLSVLLAARDPALDRRTGPTEPPVSRDLGNLLLMWTMTWAYLGFMQFLVIWSEDLPREIAWYLPRLHTGWQPLALALVLMQGAIPFLALLFRAVKDTPSRLACVAALMLAASLLDSAWSVLPSVAPHSLQGWWLVPLQAGGMTLLLLGGLSGERRVGRGEEIGHARA